MYLSVVDPIANKVGDDETKFQKSDYLVYGKFRSLVVSFSNLSLMTLTAWSKGILVKSADTS